jgi:hypothetical protein
MKKNHKIDRITSDCSGLVGIEYFIFYQLMSLMNLRNLKFLGNAKRLGLFKV